MDAERPNMETIERFPADIEAAARAVVERGYDEGLLISVKRALLAERERCAKIAENWEPVLRPGTTARGLGQEDAKHAISRAIRKP